MKIITSTEKKNKPKIFWKQELTKKEDYCRKEEVENVIKKQWMVIIVAIKIYELHPKDNAYLYSNLDFYYFTSMRHPVFFVYCWDL